MHIKIEKEYKILNAFTITEVLVTMFIFAMIIIVSAPVITKKRINNARSQGVWECKLDENQKYYSEESVDGGAETRTNYQLDSFCTFEPKPNVSSYSVTVVGGGGGGASATIAVPDAVSYGSAVAYTIPENGYYDVLIIGGGGGGGAKLMYSATKGGSGGAGGVRVLKNQNFKRGDRYVLEAGLGGAEGGAERPCYTSSWQDYCYGKDGNESKFYKFATTSYTTASGGKGGVKNSNGSGGSPSCGSNQAGNAVGGGAIFTDRLGTGTYGACSDARTYLGEARAQYAAFGHGGAGTLTSTGRPGHNGIVFLMSRTFYSGGGGQQGSAVYRTIKEIKNPVKVYIGRGGAGAITENLDGEQGESSSFGNYAVAAGGDGGLVKANSSTSDSSVLAGSAGGMSPYGGTLQGGSSSSFNGKNDMDTNKGFAVATDTTYGAGGGGGAAKNRKNCSAGNNYAGCWGKGGRGAPGYVRVEWN